MALTKEQTKEFEVLVRPIMQFLGKLHPHVKIIIESNRAELVEGITGFTTHQLPHSDQTVAP